MTTPPSSLSNCARLPPGSREQRLGAEILQVAFGNQRWRVAALARPAEEREAAAVGAWAGDDQVAGADAFDAADAASVKVEFDRGAEPGAAVGDHFAGIEQRDDQRPLLSQRVAQPDQQRAVGCRGQPFDVEAAVGLGRQAPASPSR